MGQAAEQRIKICKVDEHIPPFDILAMRLPVSQAGKGRKAGRWESELDFHPLTGRERWSSYAGVSAPNRK